MANPFPNRCPTVPQSERPKERSLNSESCKVCIRNLSRSTRRSAGYVHPNRTRCCPRKKTAESIRREVAREVDQLLRVVFQERRKTGHLDLEATEMALRAAMHHAGATALSELLQFPVPTAGERSIPCACG